MELSEIIPQDSVLKLENGREYVIRAINLDDEVWLAENFKDNLKEVIAKGNLADICKIIFHQMKIEDQLTFKKQERKFINDEGEEFVENVGGSKLFAVTLSGMNDKKSLITCLLNIIGISRPMIEKIEGDVKKKMMFGPTGEKYLTDSQVSMVGQAKKSGVSPSKKYHGDSRKLQRGKKKT